MKNKLAMIKKISWFFIFSFSMLWLIFSTMWASMAVYFGDSSTGSVQLIVSIAILVVGFSAVIVLLFVSSWRKRVITAQTIMFLAVILYWFNIHATNQRLWQTDVQKLAYADVAGDFVTVYNIRNFSYRSEFDYQPNYYDKTLDLNKLEGVDLLAVYWMGPAIAHIMLTFDFGEKNQLAISIEARKEVGEGFSTIKGFFRQYELVYIVADENDVVKLRTHYRHNPEEQVYRYRLKMKKDNAKRLFLEYIKNINAVYKTPVFYNTLFTNCTTVIWLQNKVNPNRLPFSWKILLSGYVPEYLYESNGLDQQLPFSKLRDQAYVNPLVK